MANWQWDHMPDLKDKTIIVTGANSGLGFEAVKTFALKNATVILASRDRRRGEEAKDRILKDQRNSLIEVMPLDLGDLDSVRTFARAFTRGHDRLDVLLNNAGIMWCPYAETKDGFESQMGVNHLGHFALTALLFDILRRTANSRIVNVSSMGHRNARWDSENIMFNRDDYDPNLAYYNSKHANLLFTYELQRRIEERGLNMMSVAAHPGGSATNLARHVEKKLAFRLLKPLFSLLAQSAAQGTLPEVRASVDPNVKGGEYYGPQGMGEIRGYPVLVSSTEASHDLEDAKKLWRDSERLTGITFDVAA